MMAQYIGWLPTGGYPPNHGIKKLSTREITMTVTMIGIQTRSPVEK